MTRSKSIIGALVLCALAVCAFAAASASAAGLTAVECVKVGGENGHYKTSHCTTPKEEKKEFDTVVLTAGKHAVEGKDTREITETEHGLGSTANPVAVFHSTFNGVEVTVTCGIGNTTGGSVENKEEGGEMKIHTTNSVVTWKECHASPRTKPTKICTVQGTAPAEPEAGLIKTNPLTAITGPEHKVTIKPMEGEVFTEFRINASGGECFTTAAVNVKVTGEAFGRANTVTHSHLTLDEASNKGSSLKANGNAASQTETVTGVTPGPEELTVGSETF